MTEEKKQKQGMEQLKLGDIVYFTAFTKENHNNLYMCKGEITKIPDGNHNRVFRVKILTVADRAIGNKPSSEQKSLIGRAISKPGRELHKYLGPIMMPKNWLN